MYAGYVGGNYEYQVQINNSYDKKTTSSPKTVSNDGITITANSGTYSSTVTISTNRAITFKGYYMAFQTTPTEIEFTVTPSQPKTVNQVDAYLLYYNK